MKGGKKTSAPFRKERAEFFSSSLLTKPELDFCMWRWQMRISFLYVSSCDDMTDVTVQHLLLSAMGSKKLHQ